MMDMMSLRAHTNLLTSVLLIDIIKHHKSKRSLILEHFVKPFLFCLTASNRHQVNTNQRDYYYISPHINLNQLIHFLKKIITSDSNLKNI